MASFEVQNDILKRSSLVPVGGFIEPGLKFAFAQQASLRTNLLADTHRVYGRKLQGTLHVVSHGQRSHKGACKCIAGTGAVNRLFGVGVQRHFEPLLAVRGIGTLWAISHYSNLGAEFMQLIQ